VPTFPGVVAVAAAVTLALAGCTADDAEDPRTDTGRSSCATADGEGPRVGLAYDVGGRGDHGLNDGAYAGLVAAVDEVDATCVEAEADPGESASDRVGRIRKLAVEGHDPVIAIGDEYVDATAELAAEFPDTSFAVVGVAAETPAPPDNVAHLVFADAEGSHLVGAAAAAASSTGKVGVVGLATTPRDVVDGFRAGARATRRDVVVRVGLVERPRRLRAAAAAQLRRGVDVVYDVSGTARSGVPRAVAAAEEGLVIGFGADLRPALPQAEQEAVLTSMLRRADTATLSVVRGAAEGEPVRGRQTLGVAEDGVGWATPGDLPDDVAEALEAAAERVEAGPVTAR